MKKKYEKPVLLIESFQLDAAIAGSCSGEGYIAIGHWAETCGDGTGNEHYKWYAFSDTTCEVDVAGPEDDGSDSFCYHGPMASGGLTYTWS